MVGGDDQAQFLLVEAARDEVRGVGHRGGQAQVEFARAQALQHGLAVVLDQAEADARVVGAEGVQQAGHGLGAHGVQKAEGDLAGGGVGVGADLLGGAFDLGEGAFDRGEEGAAGPGQGHRAAVAGEQFDAQVLFEAGHGPGEGGLRHLHLLGGARDVLGAGHAGEVGEAGGEQPGHVVHVSCVTGL